MTITNYYSPTMTKNKYPAVQYRVAIWATADHTTCSSSVIVWLDARNTSGTSIPAENLQKTTVTVNGYAISFSGSRPALAANAGWTLVTYGEAEVAHNTTTGAGSAAVSVHFEFGPSSLYTFTVGSYSGTTALETIDMTLPTISTPTFSVDRYGLNASAAFTVAHASYDNQIVTLKILCENAVATARSSRGFVNSNTWAVTSSTYSSTEKNLLYTFVGTYGKSMSCNVDLESLNDSEPWTSGKTYYYTITALNTNGKTATRTGTFTVPQKVTGVTADDYIGLLVNGTEQISYSVQPSNAQLQTVTFASSNTAIATVSASGLVTGVAVGTATITITTTDGGFTDLTTVDVVEMLDYIPLPHVTKLTATFAKKINTGQITLRNNLIANGITPAAMTDISFDAAMNPLTIRAALNSLYLNCVTLKTASNGAYPTGITLTALPNTNTGMGWFVYVNAWIDFLNALNTAVNGLTLIPSPLLDSGNLSIFVYDSDGVSAPLLTYRVT